MPIDTEPRRRSLDLPKPYRTNHGYIRTALSQHHREIGALQAEMAELRGLIEAMKGTD